MRRGDRPRSFSSLSGGARQRHARNAANPRSVAGCNRPVTSARRKPSRWCETTRAERGLAFGSAGPKGASAPGSGRAGGMPVGGRHSNPKRGGTNERRFQRFHERSEGEVKATKAVYPRLRPEMADVKGMPWRPVPATVQGHEGGRETPNDSLPDRPLEKRSILKDASDSGDLEGLSNSTRAAHAGFGWRGIEIARETLQGRNRA